MHIQKNPLEFLVGIACVLDNKILSLVFQPWNFRGFCIFFFFLQGTAKAVRVATAEHAAAQAKRATRKTPPPEKTVEPLKLVPLQAPTAARSNRGLDDPMVH